MTRMSISMNAHVLRSKLGLRQLPSVINHQLPVRLSVNNNYISRRNRHRKSTQAQEIDDIPIDDDNDFILSILQASPSARDSRSYLSSFAPPLTPTSPPSPTPTPTEAEALDLASLPPQAIIEGTTPKETRRKMQPLPQPNTLVKSLLNPILRRPALVKIQGPFTDAQLDSICRGMAHLQKLGLVSVIVVERDDLPSSEPQDRMELQRQRTLVRREVERVVHALGRHRAPARPVFSTVARMADPTTQEQEKTDGDVFIEEEGLDHVRRAVEEGEIPVLLPVALDASCRSRRVPANRVLLALASAMSTRHQTSTTTTSVPRMDLTPLRLLVINREGGIPSYARSGLPHLSINLSSEYNYINRTFRPHWRQTHPTALANLSLASGCLRHMPSESSALIVSHRSPASMIANLITNKPAHSASLPHALLVESEGRITRDTPTILRKGLPVRVLRSMDEVDQDKLTKLLEKSFKRSLDKEKFYERLKRDLDFVIVVGDYAGAAVCTLEGRSLSNTADENDEGVRENDGICYLDKFAVDPSHQGDGTVDFLWVALRDETYGLGLPDSSNPSIGSLRGVGRGRDLTWRSRADNPVNKWYFERSSGFITTKDGKWKVFWCDAEQRLEELWKDREFAGGRLVRVVEEQEMGRVERWERVIGSVPSAWAS